ncbi:glycerophosphodiester phosphodiesterase family protein [Flavobacteriaceae bacterium F89]|uniref:Glycerophosphodiester phosphodiesterase family protein n=1 Tax=Cerina litoralis TaxID=2874477 RepID=A0AAE3EVI6_9FLAO|nr:glycerophosphodiester phosphodiesterase family protein [Cerina litoralis]MCG2460417.1 glycerophosphodiester phosphodiesterase family protein [Cerina litoralis]
MKTLQMLEIRLDRACISVWVLLLCHTVLAQDMKNHFLTPKNGSTYVIAHRGAHHHAPENSLLAYRNAIKMGCDFVEIDLRKTKDGKFVSVHNQTVDAYFEDKTGKVKDFTLAELKQVPLAGNNLGLETQYIPTFEEILELCKGKIGIYLDLKEPDIKNQVQIIEEYGMERDIVWYIPASDHEAIERLKMYCGECFVMPDPGKEKNLLPVLQKIQPKIIATDMGHLSASFVDTSHRNGAKVFVDDSEATETEWSHIINIGTDGIQTDRPEKLIQFLKKEDKN